MFRFIITVGVLCLGAHGALCASKPAAPPKPVDVNVVSLPPAATAEVKVSNFPAPDPAGAELVTSTDRLVSATWVLGLVTLFTAAIALVIAGAQGRETTRRDRAAMLRELNRVANKVMVTAARLKQLASDVVPTRNHLHVLLHQGGMPAPIKAETEETLRSRHDALDKMVAVASKSSADLSNLEALSDKELSDRIWSLDAQIVRLEGIDATITRELEKYERESATIRHQNTAMNAAALGAKLSQPLKTKLGE